MWTKNNAHTQTNIYNGDGANEVWNVIINGWVCWARLEPNWMSGARCALVANVTSNATEPHIRCKQYLWCMYNKCGLNRLSPKSNVWAGCGPQRTPRPNDSSFGLVNGDYGHITIETIRSVNPLANAKTNNAEIEPMYSDRHRIDADVSVRRKCTKSKMQQLGKCVCVHALVFPRRNASSAKPVASKIMPAAFFGSDTPTRLLGQRIW